MTGDILLLHGDFNFEVYCVSLVVLKGVLFCFVYVELCKGVI